MTIYNNLYLLRFMDFQDLLGNKSMTAEMRESIERLTEELLPRADQLRAAGIDRIDFASVNGFGASDATMRAAVELACEKDLTGGMASDPNIRNAIECISRAGGLPEIGVTSPAILAAVEKATEQAKDFASPLLSLPVGTEFMEPISTRLLEGLAETDIDICALIDHEMEMAKAFWELDRLYGLSDLLRFSR